MIGQAQLAQLHDATVYDSAGDKIGGVKQVFVDDATGEPVVASVHTGMFGMSESFVPVHNGELSDGRVTLSVDKEMVRNAPRLEPEGSGDTLHLSDQQVSELYAYYNLPYGGGRRDYGRTDMQDTAQPMAGQNTGYGTGQGTAQGRAQVPETGGTGDAAMGDAAALGGMGTMAAAGGRTGHDTDTGMDTATGGLDTGDGSRLGETPEVTLYEEQLHVGTERVESGKVRLVKHVVTENVTKTVPVSHEEVRVERVPLDGTSAEAGHDFAEETIEATTYAERPVVETEAVPVEKVRLEKDVQTTDEQVSGEVRREEIDIEDGRRDIRG